MPGLLNYQSSPGLLGGLQQIAGGPGYGSNPLGFVGGGQIGMGASQEDRQEYEALKMKGYTGTFEEFMAEKRKRKMGGY